MSLFGSDLLSQLGHFVFHKVLDDCLVSNFSFQLFVDLSLGVGDDPFDHFILLVHFSGFEGLDLSQFGFLAGNSLFPLEPLLADQLSHFLFLPEEFKAELFDLGVLVLRQFSLGIFFLEDHLLQEHYLIFGGFTWMLNHFSGLLEFSELFHKIGTSPNCLSSCSAENILYSTLSSLF